MKNQLITGEQKILVKQLYLKIDENKVFTFAYAKNDEANSELITLKGEVIEYKDQKEFYPLIEHHVDTFEPPIDHMGEIKNRIQQKYFSDNDFWFDINESLISKMTDWSRNRLTAFLSSMFMDCDPSKKIKLKNLAKMENRLNIHEKLEKIASEKAQDKESKFLERSKLVQEYIESTKHLDNPSNLNGSTTPQTCPETIQQDDSHTKPNSDDNVM